MPQKAEKRLPAIIEGIPREWQLSDKGKRAVKAALADRRSLFSRYASLPVVCRGKKCPMSDTCFLIKSGEAPEDERCPIEIAAAVDLFQAYCRELDIKDHQYVDLSLVRDLVDIEIQLARADRILAADGSIIQYSPVGVTDKGQPIWRPDVHKALEIKERLLKQRREVLSALHATRKEKAGEAGAAFDPSRMAVELLARKEALEAERAKAKRDLAVETREENGVFVPEES